MESKILKKDMALRMELGIEIEERIKARFKLEMDKLTLSNQQSDQKAEKLDRELNELKKKYDLLRDQSSKLKSEHAEFKKLDPVGLKKKLDESKKKLKVKTQAVSDMTKDKVKLNDLVIKQKREIESFKKSSEES